MSFLLRFACAAATVVWLVDAAAAQTTWVNKVVLAKRPGIKISRIDKDGKSMKVAELTRADYRVLEEKDGRIKIHDGSGETGWFDKADAVLLDEAVPYFSELIRKEPKETFHYYMRASARHMKGDVDNAIKDFDEAIRLDPDAAACYIARALAWSDKKEYSKAIDDYNEALRIAGNNSFVLNNLAWLLATCPAAEFRNGDLAVKYAMRSMELDKNNGAIMDTLAAAYAEAGNFDEAVRWQLRMLEDPRYRNSQNARRRLKLYQDKKPYHGD